MFHIEYYVPGYEAVQDSAPAVLVSVSVSVEYPNVESPDVAD